MLQYITRRILIFIPTVIAISLVAFMINTQAPGDPTEKLVNASLGESTSGIKIDKNALIAEKRHELGLDLPVFYFAVTTLAMAENSAESWKKYVPAIHFYGLRNQYHQWVSRIVLHGDFGISYNSQLPVMIEIRSALPWSLLLTLFSVLISFGISIPVGMYAARYRNRFFDKASATVLFLLYALPNFLVAMLLLIFFANPQFFKWFPESGVQDAVNFDPNAPFWLKMVQAAPYLVLPLITYSYASVAFLSRQMRAGAAEIYGQDFVMTARAKGLNENRILWRHVFRNSLLPIITSFAHAFPVAIAGSVIVETIFAIPGMGREMYLAVLNYDYPLIIAVFTIFGFFTLVGYLVSDILYAIADPRISYSKT